jgi:hypothetical protein
MGESSFREYGLFGAPGRNPRILKVNHDWYFETSLDLRGEKHRIEWCTCDEDGINALRQ